jgi:hypothetical protein
MDPANLKYGGIYRNPYGNIREFEGRLTAGFAFYCNRRHHGSLEFPLSGELFFGRALAGKRDWRRA